MLCIYLKWRKVYQLILIQNCKYEQLWIHNYTPLLLTPAPFYRSTCTYFLHSPSSHISVVYPLLCLLTQKSATPTNSTNAHKFFTNISTQSLSKRTTHKHPFRQKPISSFLQPSIYLFAHLYTNSHSHPLSCSFNYAFTHSLTHPLTQRSTHLLTYIFIYSFTCTYTHSVTHPSTHSPTHILTRPSSPLLMHLSTYFTSPPIYWFIYSFVCSLPSTYSLTHSSIYSCTHLLMHPSTPNCSFIYSLTHPSTHSLNHVSTHSSISCSIYSFTHLFIHSLIHWPAKLLI